MAYHALFNAYFYYFFCWLEPFLTGVAAFYAILLTELYFQEAVPSVLSTLPPKTSHLAYSSTLHLLGNCYALLGLMSAFFLPYLNKAPIALPVKVTLLRRFFLILAIADITHIALSLYNLQAVKWRIAEWNLTAFGNIGITIGLFITRMAWFKRSQRVK